VGNNKVANTLKTWSVIICLIFILVVLFLELEIVLKFISIAYTVVTSFMFYAFGEVIDLLQDIKDKTGTMPTATPNVKEAEKELPNI
jgi:hypothetical protein